MTGLVSQLPALSERNGSSFTLALPFAGKEQQANRSRAAYHIESERIEGSHHAQQ